MTKKLDVTIERVDDILMLLASQDYMGVVELVDAHLPHGNWQGISFGKT